MAMNKAMLCDDTKLELTTVLGVEGKGITRNGKLVHATFKNNGRSYAFVIKDGKAERTYATRWGRGKAIWSMYKCIYDRLNEEV